MTDHEPTIVSGVGAYYHVPPKWIGSEPDEAEFQNAHVSDLIRDEYRRTLHHDIRVRVRRDGLFVFDCTRWSPAGVTEIPAHSILVGERIPAAVIAAERDAELRAAMRTQLMNAHQACLSSAHDAVHRRAAGLGAMVLPSRAIRMLDFEGNHTGTFNPNDPYERHVADLLAFTRGYRTKELRNRRVIEHDTIAYSFNLLDSLLRSPIDGHLQLVELLYRAGVQYFESRFAESLILSWTVCERLIDMLWARYIEKRGSADDGEGIKKRRREKLRGRDFSASVVLEVLELAGELPHELFEKINGLRRARNAWLHSLEDISDSEAAIAVLSTQQLMKHVTTLQISICLSRYGAGGGMPKRFFNSRYEVDWDALRTEGRMRT